MGLEYPFICRPASRDAVCPYSVAGPAKELEDLSCPFKLCCPHLTWHRWCWQQGECSVMASCRPYNLLPLADALSTVACSWLPGDLLLTLDSLHKAQGFWKDSGGFLETQVAGLLSIDPLSAAFQTCTTKICLYILRIFLFFLQSLKNTHSLFIYSKG